MSIEPWDEGVCGVAGNGQALLLASGERGIVTLILLRLLGMYLVATTLRAASYCSLVISFTSS